MKIIDLLNKIANGEEVPKKIKYNYKEFKFIEGAYEDEKRNDLCYYDDSCRVFLNDEVKILEEEKKIPEKIKDKYNSQISKVELAQKYNEIIDYLDYLKSKGK